ncbi:MAG: hypothetical protein AAF628_11340 [Planctomycetota bacterium]
MKLAPWPVAFESIPVVFGAAVLGAGSVFCGCSGAPPAAFARPDLPVVRPLPAGTSVRLEPAVGGADDAARAVAPLDAWWREALRQSAHLDFGGGVERPLAADWALILEYDQAADQLSATLQGAALGAPVPLGSTTVRGALGRAVDALALRVRCALGDPVRLAPGDVRAIYSPAARCVRDTEAALRAQAAGDHGRALRLLRQARTVDGGCTMTLLAVAGSELALGTSEGAPGRVATARRTATEALQLTRRLSPTTKHRLAHILLLARGYERGAPASTDRELLALGLASARDRPADPHAKMSEAVALSLLGRHAEALPLLQALAVRWPRSAQVRLHLTFAELAAGDPAAALAAIEAAAPALPGQSALVPRALALFHAGRLEALATLLADTAARPEVVAGNGSHELLRMQAALRLLRGRVDDACAALLADLDWLYDRPADLERWALDLAETGQVLAQLGRDAELAARVRAFEQLPDLSPTVTQVLVLLGGLVQVGAAGGDAAAAAATHLRMDGQTVWSSAVRAAVHQQRGELLDELRERLLEYQLTPSPLARAALARVLAAAGRPDQAQQVLLELRAQLYGFDLRRPQQHPLMSPAAALASLALKASY